MTQATQTIPAGLPAETKVKEGYKQTEIGVIPVDWDVIRIDEKAEIQTGSKNTQDRIEDGRYPFFVRSQNVERINSYSFDGEAVLTAGDGVGTGKVFHYINGKFDVHQRVYRMSKFSNGLNGKYFFYQFSTRFFDRIMSMTAKSSVDSVRREMIAGMKIPFPKDPKEQSAIATALSDTDALIENLEKLIAKKKAIKQGAMQQLLTGKKRLPGFSGEWEVKQLVEIANFYDNLRIPVTESKREDGTTPYYGANGIQGYIKGYTHDGEFVLIAEDGANDLSNYPVLYVNGKVWVNNHAHVIQGINRYAETKYLSYALKTVNFVQVLVGGTRAKLNGSVAKAIKILIPTDIAEQTAIATVLSDMDTEIEKLENKLNKYRQIKTGMMQQLLTGKIRLVKN